MRPHLRPVTSTPPSPEERAVAAIDALAERLTRNAPTGAALLATAGSPSYSPATVAAVAGTIHADAAVQPERLLPLWFYVKRERGD